MTDVEPGPMIVCDDCGEPIDLTEGAQFDDSEVKADEVVKLALRGVKLRHTVCPRDRKVRRFQILVAVAELVENEEGDVAVEDIGGFTVVAESTDGTIRDALARGSEEVSAKWAQLQDYVDLADEGDSSPDDEVPTYDRGSTDETATEDRSG